MTKTRSGAARRALCKAIAGRWLGSLVVAALNAGHAWAQMPATALLQAPSPDGAWRAVVSGTPPWLELIDGRGVTRQRHPVATLDGRVASAMADLQNLPERRSFLLAPSDLPEWWEVSYDPKAEPIHDGLVHDYRMGEAIARPGFLGVRRIPLDEALRPVARDAQRHTVLGVPMHATPQTPVMAQVIQLDVRRRIGYQAWPTTTPITVPAPRVVP